MTYIIYIIKLKAFLTERAVSSYFCNFWTHRNTIDTVLIMYALYNSGYGNIFSIVVYHPCFETNQTNATKSMSVR